MKLSQWKEYLPFVQAAAEGKKIEGNYRGSEWTEVTESHDQWPSMPPNCYRIKPEQKLRPWRPEEFKMGAIYKHKDDREIFMLGVTAFRNGVRLQDNSVAGSQQSYQSLLNNYEHSTDGGKTWQPCGVIE